MCFEVLRVSRRLLKHRRSAELIARRTKAIG